MQLNLSTAVRVVIWLALGFTVLSIAIRWIRRTHPGYGRWAFGGLLLVLSLVLLSLRSAPGWINTVSANTGIAMASILYLEGAREFRGISPSNWLAYAGAVVAIGTVAYYFYIIPNMNTRAVVMSVFVAIVLAFTSVRLLQGIPPARGFGQTFTGGMFALCAATLLARAFYCYFGPPMSDLNASSGLYGAFFIATAAEMAAFSTGLALLADERVLSDLNDAKERASQAGAEVARHIEIEAALRESEERFRTLADTAPVMVWMSGLDKLCIFFNKPWLDFRGRTLDQELGRGWVEGVHPDDRDRCSAIYNSAFESRRSFQKECRLRRADGEYRWILDHGTPLYRGGEFAGFIGSCIDITEQKLTEERLRANEVQLNYAQRLSKVGSWEFHIETDISYWSKENRRILGMPDDAPANLSTFINCVHPKDREKVLESARTVSSTGETEELQYRIIRPDGEVRFLHSVFEALRDDQNKAVRIVGATQDITDQIRAIKLLRESEERLRFAHKAANIGTFDWNIETGVSAWTPELETMHGLPAGGYPTTREAWEDLIHPDDRARVVQRVTDSYETGEPVEEEWRVIWPDRSVHWLAGRWQVFKNATGEPLRVTGVNIDITYRKRMEEALRQSEERFSLAIKATNDAIWDIDLENGIVSWNETYSVLYGRPPETSDSWQWWIDRIHPEDRERTVGGLHAAIGSTASSWTCEYRFQRADGRWAYVYDRAYITRDASGAGRRVIGAMQDLTERKRAEAELRENEQQLQSLAGSLLSAQEEERRRISRELHDDLTQRLAGLAMELGTLATEFPRASQRLKARLGALQRNVVEAAESSRHMAYQLHPAELDDLGLATALRTYCEDFGRYGIAVEFASRNLPESVNREVASCLYRIAQESLRNVAQHANSRRAWVTLEGRSDCILLQVRDDGVGFPVESLRAGGGLGLVSMQERVRHLNGSLAIQSKPEQGTVITVEVPLPKAETPTTGGFW
jgi:PAS domain S-box-containing protein